MAAYASAQLRGEGIEEVGEQMEHFPPEGYDGMGADRRLLLQQTGEDGMVEMEATRQMEDYFEIGEEEMEMEIIDEFPDADFIGEEVEDFDPEWEDPDYEGKENLRDEGLEQLIDTDLFGEQLVDTVADQRDRREAACGENQQEFKFVLATDKYGYETGWQLINRGTNRRVASGPPSNQNYADTTTYTGRWCLSAGQYQLRVTDSAGDGMCGGGVYGCGRVMTFLNGASAGKSVNDNSKWKVKNFNFQVNPGSSRIDGVSNAVAGNSGSSGEWCSKVRNRMQTQRGTCTLPNGRTGHRVRVQTKVDKYPRETSWTITSNGAVKMKMNAILAANQMKSIEDCVPPGKYIIKFLDLDGICCRHGAGFFKVSVDGKEILTGGSFTKQISHTFQAGFDWISTMNERDCEWWFAHDHRRRDWHQRCYIGKYCNKSYKHLRWSPALAQDAKGYANQLLSTCNDAGIKHAPTDQGENLAKNKGTGNWGRLYAAELVTKRFVDNEEFWGWNGNAHLTQAMWYPSRYMGCADAVKSLGDGKMCRMQVCRYAKAGNCMMGKYQSDQGKNWMIPMMQDDSPCGPMCPPRDGCFA